MTKNEYIASIMLEAAELLRDDVDSLNESLFRKNRTSDRKLRNEIKAGLEGKYDDVIVKTEENLEEFINKYGDEISEIAEGIKSDINDSRKMISKEKVLRKINSIVSVISGGAIPFTIIFKSSRKTKIITMVSLLLTSLNKIIDGILLKKDFRDWIEATRYLKMIKRKLTQNIEEIKDPGLRNKYDIIIEKINRAEDEYINKFKEDKD